MRILYIMWSYPLLLPPELAWVAPPIAPDGFLLPPIDPTIVDLFCAGSGVCRTFGLCPFAAFVDAWRHGPRQYPSACHSPVGYHLVRCRDIRDRNSMNDSVLLHGGNVWDGTGRPA